MTKYPRAMVYALAVTVGALGGISAEKLYQNYLDGYRVTHDLVEVDCNKDGNTDLYVLLENGPEGRKVRICETKGEVLETLLLNDESLKEVQ